MLKRIAVVLLLFSGPLPVGDAALAGTHCWLSACKDGRQSSDIDLATAACATADPVKPDSRVSTQMRLAGGRANVPHEKGGLKWSYGTANIAKQHVWASTSNALLDRITHYLQTDAYGFDVPERAEIVGIEVHIEKKRSILGHVEDAEVRLTKNAILVGENRATRERWPAEEQAITYGSSSDLWGTTFTPADINDSRFGVAISALMRPFGNFQTAEIGTISIIIYWREHRVPE